MSMALNSSSPSVDHHPPTAAITTNTAAASTTTRPFTNSPQQHSRPITSVPRPYPYSAQPLLPAQPRVSNPNSDPNVPKPHDTHSPQGIHYPVASSGRGFVPKHLRPQPPDQMVTVANPGAFPPRVIFPHQGGRPFGLSSSNSLNHPVHMTRPPYLQHSHPGVAGSSGSGPIKGISVSAQPKLQYGGNAKPLPRPLPIVPDTQSTKKKDGEGEEENGEGSFEHLSTQELLQRHVKHD